MISDNFFLTSIAPTAIDADLIENVCLQSSNYYEVGNIWRFGEFIANISCPCNSFGTMRQVMMARRLTFLSPRLDAKQLVTPLLGITAGRMHILANQ